MKKGFIFLSLFIVIGYFLFHEERYSIKEDVLATRHGDVLKVNFETGAETTLIHGREKNLALGIGRKSIMCGGKDYLYLNDFSIHQYDLKNRTLQKRLSPARLWDFFPETKQILLAHSRKVILTDLNFTKSTYIGASPTVTWKKNALKVGDTLLLFSEYGYKRWWLLDIVTQEKRPADWFNYSGCDSLIAFRSKTKQIICESGTRTLLVDWGGKHKTALDIDLPYNLDAQYWEKYDILIHTVRRWDFPIGERYQTMAYDFEKQKDYLVSKKYYHPIQMCTVQ